MSPPMTPEALIARLEALGLAPEIHRHRAVFTVEEGEDLRAGMRGGGHSKNLFLRDKKGRPLLLSAHQDTTVDLASVATALGYGRLSFGSPERLLAALGVTPGSVTAFALVNDSEGAVAFALDAALLACAKVYFHPLANTATVGLEPAAFLRFLHALGRKPLLVAFDPAGQARRIDAGDPGAHLVAEVFKDTP